MFIVAEESVAVYGAVFLALALTLAVPPRGGGGLCPVITVASRQPCHLSGGALVHVGRAVLCHWPVPQSTRR